MRITTPPPTTVTIASPTITKFDIVLRIEEDEEDDVEEECDKKLRCESNEENKNDIEK